jgi:hypothetical protein
MRFSLGFFQGDASAGRQASERREVVSQFLRVFLPVAVVILVGA